MSVGLACLCPSRNHPVATTRLSLSKSLPKLKLGERYMLKAGYKGEGGKFVPPHIAVVSAEEFASKTPYRVRVPQQIIGTLVELANLPASIG
jgi:hypothetical protein